MTERCPGKIKIKISADGDILYTVQYSVCIVYSAACIKLSACVSRKADLNWAFQEKYKTLDNLYEKCLVLNKIIHQNEDEI